MRRINFKESLFICTLILTAYAFGIWDGMKHPKISIEFVQSDNTFATIANSDFTMRGDVLFITTNKHLGETYNGFGKMGWASVNGTRDDVADEVVKP